MSGFVFAYGKPSAGRVRAMFGRIGHRGPYTSGVHRCETAVMAQNCLRADNASGETPLPVASPFEPGVRVCYDGQIGNAGGLAELMGVKQGHYLDERLLLKMHHDLGAGMFRELGDAVFAFVISDGRGFLTARDLLGIKPLYYGIREGNIYFSSELKCLTCVTGEVYEFPPGHYMKDSLEPVPFALLPSAPPAPVHADVSGMVGGIRDILHRSIRNRVDFSVPTGALMSGGIDSSVVAALAVEALRERFGSGRRLSTFSAGVGASEDIECARAVSEHLGTVHHELLTSVEELVEVLPAVIYYLESFDPSLVRSAAVNYLVSGLARETGMETLLAGEGGDEVFCGYAHLKSVPENELFGERMRCLGALHNSASLRLDRMNACNSLRIVTPLISGELLDYALSIPPDCMIRTVGGERVEKWIFRKAFEKELPAGAVWRVKQEFSQGAGSASALAEYFEGAISDSVFASARWEFPALRSKEELYYYQIFRDHFGSPLAEKTVGRWVFT